jgi:hypothetical protein
MTQEMSEVLGPVGFLLVLAWIIKVSLEHRRWNRATQVQSDLQSKLLDKFSTTTELMEYLKSDAGNRFIESATAVQANPYSRILSSVQSGAVLSLAGLAFLLMSGKMGESEQGFILIGALAAALGVGFLISALISFFLSKSWGLINGDHKAPGSDRLSLS